MATIDNTVVKSFPALVRQPVSPTSAPSIPVGLVEIWMPTEQISGPIGPPGPGVVMQDEPPVNPVNGTLWWDSATALLWAWYDDGSSVQWVQISGGIGSSVGVLAASLYYVATAGQTAFPVTVPDMAGQSSSFSALSDLHVTVSGTRLAPTDGFTRAVANTVTLVYPAATGEPVLIDIWGPV